MAMTVTDIVEISRARFKIVLDNDAVFVLYREEIKAMSINKGGELPDEKFRYITDELLVKRARLRGLNLLKSRDYTRYQMVTKLKQGLYPDSVIEAAIDYFVSYGYIDDVRYAASYIGYAGASKSRKRIEYDLQKKGVSAQDIMKAYLHCEEQKLLIDEEQLIEEFLIIKHYCEKCATFEERRKIIASLYLKGFSLDKIYKAVGQFE